MADHPAAAEGRDRLDIARLLDARRGSTGSGAVQRDHQHDSRDRRDRDQRDQPQPPEAAAPAPANPPSAAEPAIAARLVGRVDHPDAVTLIDFLATRGPHTYGAAAAALGWGATRAWQAEARLRSAGTVRLCSLGRMALQET